MQVGDLVKIIRPSGLEKYQQRGSYIGVPLGTIGIILERRSTSDGIVICVVQLCNDARQRRYLLRDLEVISASR